MIKEFIGTGKDVEAATAAAKAGLNAPAMADVKVEIIEMPKKGFLGIGSKPAQVRASYDDGRNEKKPAKKANKKQAPKPAPQQPKKPVKKDAPKKEAAPKAKEQKKAQPAEKDYPEKVDLEYAKAYLGAIVKGLKIDDAEIAAEYAEGIVTMEINCDNYGIIIGRRGETLDSIQYLLSLAMKKQSNGYVRVVINVGDYREKRKGTLKHLAEKNANYVLRTGKRYTFEPMNPYERRIIHTTVQGIEGVESRSIGYDQERRVIIEPTGGVKPRSNGGNRSKEAKPATAPKPIDGPKFGKIEVKKD